MGTPRLSATTSLSAIGTLSAISVATAFGPAPPQPPTLPGLLRAPGAPPHAIGHRGHPAAAPENTLASLHAARRTGAEYVELDTGISADGIPYVLHDDTPSGRRRAPVACATEAPPTSTPCASRG